METLLESGYDVIKVEGNDASLDVSMKVGDCGEGTCKFVGCRGKGKCNTEGDKLGVGEGWTVLIDVGSIE